MAQRIAALPAEILDRPGRLTRLVDPMGRPLVSATVNAMMSAVKVEGVSRLLSVALAGYLVGSLPSAELAQRLSGSTVDLRQDGSGNPGATNVDGEQPCSLQT